ncbi:MAG: 1,4-dihydroxy-2-naphthoate polyprenyltransferase [Ilumatobacteraceae bacterium]|nr:1,4-dihydroxy-2-naphthoate polyprenyltransferase [Ilumatobacteraceae bacterium]
MMVWITGARPRTLPAAAIPVAVGAAAAVGEGGSTGIVWWRVLLAMVVSLALQVGVNYANDYSDGVRGTDDVRVGPTRLVASGMASAGAVKRAAMLSFVAAAVCGLAIALDTTLWLLVVGVAAIAAGWFYTGGPKPYGYIGLGEAFVFVFFGLVATAGTTYAAIESITALSLVMGCAMGSLACALLVINNLRDIPTDRDVGKKTLAVRLGTRRTQWLYVGLLGAAFAVCAVAAFWRPSVLLAFLAAPLAIPPGRAVLGGASGAELIPVLGATGRLQVAVGLGAAIGLAVGG